MKLMSSLVFLVYFPQKDYVLLYHVVQLLCWAGIKNGTQCLTTFYAIFISNSINKHLHSYNYMQLFRGLYTYSPLILPTTPCVRYYYYSNLQMRRTQISLLFSSCSNQSSIFFVAFQNNTSYFYILCFCMLVMFLQKRTYIFFNSDIVS